MPIFLKGKTKYVKNLIDRTEHCLTTGHFLKFLQSKGIGSVSDYVIQFECPIPRPTCKVCNKPAKQEGVDGIDWKFSSTCGDKECAIEMRRRGRKALTKEQEAESVRKRNETFAKNPELLKRRSQLAHEANLKVGNDKLTGYERTALKRKQTLAEKYGRTDYANWEKSKQTWEEKTADEIRAHGNKVREAWENKSHAQKKDEIDRRRVTNIIRYGMECPGNMHLFKGYSEKAASLFKHIDTNSDAEFKPKCREFSINGKLFDFRLGNNLIEFNGDYWHANPKKYGHDFQVGRSRKRSAQQIWEADARKIALAEANGYRVKVVWESDYKKDPEKVIKECVEWLKN